jgi:dihydrofolate reductase
MAGIDPPVALVVAVAENGVIGKDGGLPWRIPSEMRHFRQLTMDKPVIMGRRTFASLKKPLEGRDNIVLTHNREYAPQGAIAVESVEQALNVANGCALARAAKEIMVIGGAEIYAAMLPHARRLHLTRVHAKPDGGVHFPDFDLSEWREVSSQYHQRGEKDEFDYTICLFERQGTVADA